MSLTESRPGTAEVVNFVSQQVRNGRSVALEGPPVYLYPMKPSHEWTHPAFTNGWKLVDRINGLKVTLDTTNVAHWALIDDFNGRPNGRINVMSAEGAISRIVTESPSMQDLPVFTNIPNDFRRGRGHWEGELVTKALSCDQLDANFQILKLTESIPDYKIGLAAPAKGRDVLGVLDPHPLMLVVHPEGFQPQQEAMLVQLLGRMKLRPYVDRIYGKMPVADRKKLIESTYLHIWLGDDGEITETTSPVWDDQKNVFKHKPRELA